MKVGYVHKDSTTDENIRKEFSDVIYPTMVIRTQAETIELQEKEIKRLNNKNEELLSLYTTEREVKDYYKNIINELEKWLEDNLGNCRTNQNYTSNQIYNLKEDIYYRCLDKLKTLKENNKDV